MFLSLLLSGYFVCVLGFSLVSLPVMQCLFLLGGSLFIVRFVYVCFGFRWYLIMFSLVYVGGVLILFVYISLYNPKVFISAGGGVLSVFFSFVFFVIFF